MSTRLRPIVITGFMGAGKTTTAAALARKLACGMIDLDCLIEEREGRTIREIIDADGERAFREIESRALAEALKTTSEARVIALGGGAWTIERNRALISEHDGFTVWLDAPFELCWQRIESGLHDRPLARDEGRTRELYEERRASYVQAALRVEVTEWKSAATIATEIVAAMSRFAA